MFNSRTPVQSPNLTVMTRAVLKAARGLVRDFGEIEKLQVSQKGPGNFVTTADLRVEKTLRSELSRARPTYGFLMEEGGEVQGEDKDHRWIIDPVDGTTNFMHGIPHFAISLALQRDKEIVAAVLYDPVKDEMFTAEKGGGAYLNGQRLRVSTRHKLPEAVIAAGTPFIGTGSHEKFKIELMTILPRVSGIRNLGAASLDLAYVAAGRFEGYFERGIAPWDIAAGILLVQEAGGTVVDLKGGKNMLEEGTILAANEPLCGPLFKLLKESSL